MGMPVVGSFGVGQAEFQRTKPSCAKCRGETATYQSQRHRSPKFTSIKTVILRLREPE